MSDLPPGYRGDSPSIPVAPVTACVVCGGTQGAGIARGFDYELQTCADAWHVWQCGGCGAASLRPRPDIEALPVIYPANYYSYAMSETLSPLVLWGKGVLDRLKFRGILRALGRTASSYMDIGCGDGHYLELMARQGAARDRVFGIELGAPQAARARGFRIFDERVETCEGPPNGSLDLVTMFHVIEHVADPVLVLARIRDWLAPDGLLALETPNLDSWDARMFRGGWWGGYHFPRHWVLFDPATIRVALDKAGLEIQAIRYQTGHSFWLYSFHHLLRYNRLLPMPGLARLFDPLRSKVMLILFTGLDVLRRSLGLRTSAMLILARRKP